MRDNILPKDFPSKLMPTDDYGEFAPTTANLNLYIEAVLQYLQSNHQSLNIPDFVDVIIQSLDLDLDIISVSNALTFALRYTLIYKRYKMSGTEELIYDAIDAWLLSQADDYKTYSRYRALLAADFPMPSTLNPRKIAVWRNTSKMGDWGKRQAVSVRKWIGSTFTDFTDEQSESLAKRIDAILQTPAELDVKHHSSYEYDAWERAYSSDKINSCMNTDSSSEVGYKRTFTCYCSGYHGLPDNGLNLTVLYQDGKPVARAITFTHHEQNYYIRVYGDDRLCKWLNYNGYEQSAFAVGTILYTTELLIKPYIDGYVHMADHHTTNDGKHYWVLASDGEYGLQTTDAYASEPVECDCCGYDYHTNDTQEVLSHVNGRYYTVCENCLENNSYEVYTGYGEPESLFFHDGEAPDTNRGYVEYDDAYYETESLPEHDLHLIDGEVYHDADLYYCDFTDEYFVDSDDVYTDAAEISTEQPVHFPYECVSKEYWDDNVVECACGTLALPDNAREISTPSLGSVLALYDYFTFYTRHDGSGVYHTGLVFKLDDIERAYECEPSEKMQALRDYAIAFNKIQFLRFQELGI